MSTNVGTPYYQAPEIYEGNGYDEKADLWSLGIILFQLVSGKLPFTISVGGKHDLFKKIKLGVY